VVRNFLQHYPQEWVGRRVWCYGAQTYRPFGTAAEYTVVPIEQAVPLPAGVTFEQGTCLGIPGITAHRAVHAAGSVEGRTVLVQGGAGAGGGLCRSARSLRGSMELKLPCDLAVVAAELVKSRVDGDQAGRLHDEHDRVAAHDAAESVEEPLAVPE
jgi:hypothetical protein